MSELEKICAEVLEKAGKVVDSPVIIRTEQSSNAVYITAASKYADKLARACQILRKELEESLRVCDAAIDDIKYKEIKKNKTELMLESCRKANDLALKKIEEILK